MNHAVIWISDMDISDSDSEMEDRNDIEERERQLEYQITAMQASLEKAREHVRAYQVQRDESKCIMSLAKLDIANLLPSLCRRRVLTIDMGQNLNLPNFEGEQPGDTYYMSPLTVLLFGVVENATEDGYDRMNAYIVWREFEGDRGANNITSCLLMDLKRRGWLSRPNYGRLTYIADNCGGQNKNKIVIRFLMWWLVENRIFPVVQIFFLVKGHTKNSADRLFNLVKLRYHKVDTFTYDKLYDTVNENPYINVHKMLPEDFKDHLEWQDKMYRTPAGGQFKQSHVFTIYNTGRQNAASTLIKQATIESNERIDSLLPTGKNKKAIVHTKEDRKRLIANMEADLKQLTSPGLRPIKQVELWKKWGPLLPESAREVTCPKPSDEIIESIKKSNWEKSKFKRAQQVKRKRMETSDGTANKSSKILAPDVD